MSTRENIRLIARSPLYNSGICAKKKRIPTLPADSGIEPGYSRIAQGVFYRFLLYPGIGLTK